MAGHTPGPWHTAGGCIRDEHDHEIAQTYNRRHWEPGFGPMPEDEERANASLSAAAPDLLHALKVTTDWLAAQRDVVLGNSFSEEYAALELARAVIKKAEATHG